MENATTAVMRTTVRQKYGWRIAHPRISLSRSFKCSSLPAQVVKESSPTPAKAVSFDPSKAPVSIPGSGWLKIPFNAYSSAQTRRPYLTQIVSSIIIYFLGDLSSQFIQGPVLLPEDDHPHSSESISESSTRSDHVYNYDPVRSVRAVIIGAAFSIPSYHWFLYLSRLWSSYPHLVSLSFKVLFNQITFAPVFNSYFFSMQSLLSGAGGPGVQGRVEAAWRRVKDTVPTTWYSSCKFWPLVTAFSFTFVQPRSRSVFAGIVAMGWQSYLGLVNQRVIEKSEAFALHRR